MQFTNDFEYKFQDSILFNLLRKIQRIQMSPLLHSALLSVIVQNPVNMKIYVNPRTDQSANLTNCQSGHMLLLTIARSDWQTRGIFNLGPL